MPYSSEQLEALKKALATGERRVSFGDRTVEYRSTDELKAAIREVEDELARTAGMPNANLPWRRYSASSNRFRDFASFCCVAVTPWPGNGILFVLGGI